jgi:hypothetical protein
MISFAGLDMFRAYPEVLRLGLPMLRVIGAAWRLTPLAREFAIAELAIDTTGRLDFTIDAWDRFDEGDELPFPVESLVRYAADCLPTPERSAVLTRLAANRRAAGPIALWCNGGRALVTRPLFISCPGCASVLEVRGAVMSDGSSAPFSGPIRCRTCSTWWDYAGATLSRQG